MIRLSWRRALVVAAVLSVFGTGGYAANETGRTGAERLVERLPDDVIGFAATSGGTELKAGFNKSQIGQIWHEASVQDFYRQIKTAVLNLAWKDQARDKKNFDLLMELLDRTCQCPTAIGVSERPGAGKSLPICFFMISDGEKNRTVIDETIGKLMASADKPEKFLKLDFGGSVMHGVKEDGHLVYWGWVDGYFVLAFNDEGGKLVFDLKTATSAATQRTSRWAVDRVGGTDDLIVMGMDLEKIFQLLRQNLDKDGRERMEKVLGPLGVPELRQLICRSGFSGPDMVHDSLLAMPATAGDTGIFKQFRPVELSLLDLVPAEVTTATVCNPDYAGLYDLALKTIRAASDSCGKDIEKALGEFEAGVKLDVRRDLLENLAGPTVTYSMPGNNLNPMTASGVFVFKLKDPKAFEKALTAVEEHFAKKFEGKFQTTVQEMDGVKYHFWMVPQLAMAQISPCWTVSGDEWVIGTAMPTVGSAVRRTTTQNAEKTSVRTAPGFIQMTKDLPGRLISLKYVDQKRQAEESLRVVQQFWPMAVMMMNKNGKMKLPMMLPPPADIVKHLGPQVEYSWLAPEGIRSHGRGPILGSEASMAVAAGILAGTMVPALGRSREMANRAVSASNLRQIYTAGYRYANDKGGKFPDTLPQLAEAKQLDVKILESPLKPKGFTGPSYIYIPGQEADSDPRNILGYENPAYQSEGTNALYVDGHVQWMKPEGFTIALAETYKRLGRPMPEVKFQSGKGGWNLGNLFRKEPPTTQPTTRPKSEINLNLKIPFKCTNCETTVRYTIRELRQMQKPGYTGPMMGPMVIECPKCKKKTLSQAWECPKCGEVMGRDWIENAYFEGKCPNCGANYVKAWQEKHKKSQE